MRLDVFLVEKNLYKSRNKSAEAIKRGDVTVNGKTVLKPSFEVSENDGISVKETAKKYVSVGAYKLEKAFSVFPAFSVKDKTVCDIGASTGGFTEICLINRAKKVFAVDVGEALLDRKLAKDERVFSVENTNARFLNEKVLGEKVDRVVSDVSFISLTMIIPAIAEILNEEGEAVLLVKPQFECGSAALNKNGIVTDYKYRAEAVKKVIRCARENNLFAFSIDTASIIQGKNVEYLLYLTKNKDKELSELNILKKIEN